MNNSELSVAVQSANAFTEPRTYVYPSSWDNVTEKRLQDDTWFHNRRNSDGTAGIDCSEATTVHDVTGRQAVEARPQLEVEQPDLGLWLLCGGVIRHDQWERLRGIAQSAATPRHFSLSGSSNLVKRYCDVVGSLFLLIVLFPLFILIAVLIKLDSPGPVFFRHHRVGKNGKHFVLWKFRSMKTEVPKYENSPRSVGDVRLTRIGRLIRRTSIDEIPQLINVLKGEMSLVGPRPEMPFIVAQYHSVECERFAVKPGITGLWQISPARAFPIHENLQYDLHYIRNQNFFLDCVIILRTITAVIHGVGAV
jgi:lipopolysaccharide/colanic/teichoic acid biosynthesis glycosyltransferase